MWYTHEGPLLPINTLPRQRLWYVDFGERQPPPTDSGRTSEDIDHTHGRLVHRRLLIVVLQVAAWSLLNGKL